MTRVDFHFNVADPLDYGCRLARKIVQAGQRAHVWCDDGERLAAWDGLLWTFDPTAFVPHVRADDPLAAETPIVLIPEGVERPDRDLLVRLPGAPSEAPAPYFSRYQRLIEIVGTAEPDRLAARARWRFYRERGYEIHTHEAKRAA